MCQDVPDHLVINLLALADAAPDLPPDVLQRLAGYAPKVEPDADALARVSLEICIDLLDQPAFRKALVRWRAERTRLNIPPPDTWLPNPCPYPAKSLVECVANVACKAVEDPKGLAQHPEARRWLEDMLRRRQPHEGSQP